MELLTTATTSASPLRTGFTRLQENQRLAALSAYQSVGTAPEVAFDDLARLASFICQTPVSLVSLIDSERQWFKGSNTGQWPASVQRERNFCEEAMQGHTLYVVEDATAHPIFSAHESVINDPNIRFYAGHPLLTPQGKVLGTLCTLDMVPRSLTDDQRAALAVLAQEVVAHLELRRAHFELEQERLKLEGLLALANDRAENMYMHQVQNEIFIKQDNRLVRIKTTDIRYVEALGDYVNVYAGAERFTLYGTMKELEAKLPIRDFARVHRKYIVRLDRIIAIENDALLVETDRSAEGGPSLLPVPIGNSFKAGLFSRLTLI